MTSCIIFPSGSMPTPSTSSGVTTAWTLDVVVNIDGMQPSLAPMKQALALMTYRQ